MSDKKLNVKMCVLLPIVLAVTIFLWAVPVSFYGIEALTVVQQRVIALFVFAALMWMFEIIPNWTTSLLLIVLTLLTISDKGIGLFCDPKFGTLVSYKSLMASFADPVVMLFMGGFVLAIMAEKYGLDVTLARILLKPFGTKPSMVLLGFLIVIAVFSMFMSNTATAAMMLAFLAPVLSVLPSDDKGKIGLSLAIPVAANIGGIGTPIGTPPNATAVRFLTEAGYDVSFSDWSIRMIPYVLIMILVAWVILQLLFPFKTKKLVLDIPANKRPVDWKTYVVWITFIGTILLWATESLTGINSNVVALDVSKEDTLIDVALLQPANISVKSETPAVLKSDAKSIEPSEAHPLNIARESVNSPVDKALMSTFPRFAHPSNISPTFVRFDEPESPDTVVRFDAFINMPCILVVSAKSNPVKSNPLTD